MLRGENKEIYKGESKVDNVQAKLNFIQYLRALPSQMLKLQLSLSIEMTDQLLSGPIKKGDVPFVP